ncbi:DDE-1 domain-containing protein [Durusdinium trenchii]|uniref:DDE-1 domain-containing protein n=1 Tax=Durusdinium trenchii TaxID=1381693 RepID=A0ABP0JS71_9DINO
MFEDTFILPQDHVAPDAALTSESSKLTQNDVAGTDCKEPGAGDPPHGWERRAKKSQQHWYARICAFRDGGQKRKQADYVAKWKAMTNGQQDAFRREVTAKLSNTGSAAALECQPNKTLLPWEVESDAGRTIQLPQGYTTDDLARDFEQYSHHPAGHDQKRWEMYGLLHLLLKDAGTKLQKPATAESELKALKINKKQLYKIATMFPEHLPFECPPIFRMWRTPQSSLSVAEKEDLWTYIRFHECTGSSLCVQEVEKAIVVMKMEKMGHLRDEPPVGELQSRIESMLPKYNHLWRDLKEWRRKTKPPSEQLSVSKLKLKTGYEVTSCTPQVVAAVLSGLEDMCTRAGIMRDGILLEKEAGRLIITDEKGLSFVFFLEQCLIKPARERYPDTSIPLILILDSGGGSNLHISVSMALLCHRHNIMPYVLPAYTTAACCPLDSNPHSTMSKLWSGFKAAWVRQHGSLNIHHALAGIRRCVIEGLSETQARAGWAQCGWTPGERIQRFKVLNERATELFHCKDSWCAPTPQSKISSALSIVEKVSPQKKSCSADGRKAKVSVVDKFCGQCGAANSNYESKTAELYKAKRSGWLKPPQLLEVAAENATEKQLAVGVGELFKKLRSKDKGQADSGHQEQALEDPLPAPGKGATTSAEKIVEEAVEFDLNEPDGCISYIVACFPVAERDAVIPIATFYVDNELRKKTGKGHPLWEVFRMNVISSNVLGSKQARKAWLSAWSSNRSNRFAKPPKPKT